MHPDILKRMRAFYAKAEKLESEYPDAACLATADKNGRPSTRIVLVRGLQKTGFAFYTNYTSRKGRELADNPWACLNWHWKSLHVQAHALGRVRKLSPEESDAYFNARPRLSQIGAWGSYQSQPMASRAQLLARCAGYTAKFKTHPVPRPPHWGGYLLEPEEVEFWQEGAWRLHKREVYSLKAGKWGKSLLSP
jgi:pyridoxamine 5'-phosphate oxidase